MLRVRDLDDCASKNPSNHDRAVRTIMQSVRDFLRLCSQKRDRAVLNSASDAQLSKKCSETKGAEIHKKCRKEPPKEFNPGPQQVSQNRQESSLLGLPALS